jgi:hypothetical protein
MSSHEENNVVFTLERGKWLSYLQKIKSDRIILDNLLFRNIEPLSLYNKSKLCEYYSILYCLEEIIHKMADDENYDSETKSFIVSEGLAFQFSIFMQALVISKEVVTENNCSISLH